MIGTVLPTANTFKLNDAFKKREDKEKARVASLTPELMDCDRRVVGGEVRYYDTADQYAIVSRQGKVLWFAVYPDGDRRI
jgi:hypothetical protein